MGGFALDYVAGSETAVGSYGSGDTGAFTYDSYDIDSTHALVMVFTEGSGNLFVFVVDYSDPVTVVYGDIASVNLPTFFFGGRPYLTRLTDTDWIATGGHIVRFTVVGLTVTFGAVLDFLNEFDYLSWHSATGFNNTLWEGHDADNPNIQLPYGERGHTERIGLDINHVLAPGYLTWFDGTGHTAYRWYVLDLTGPSVWPVSVFVPDSTQSPNSSGAISLGVGTAYWWVWTTVDESNVLPPSGLKLALVEATTGSISVADVTGYDFDPLFSQPVEDARLGLDPDDGTCWLACAGTAVLHPFWTHADPMIYSTTMVKVDATTATTHDYLGEEDTRPAFRTEALHYDTGKLCNFFRDTGQVGVTWQITDGHLRMEEFGQRGSYYATAPPHNPAFEADFRILRGLSHNRLLAVYLDSFTFWASIVHEVGVPPQGDFIAFPDTANVGDPVTFDAQDSVSGHDSGNESRDSYWHPIDEYRWEWDDGTPDTFTSSNPTVHIYRRNSTTHSAGSETADATVIFTGQIGDIGYFLPLLRTHNSVGWSYAGGGWEIEVDGVFPSLPTEAFLAEVRAEARLMPGIRMDGG